MRALNGFTPITALLVLLLALTACGEADVELPNDSLIFITQDIPAGLNYDGPASATATTQTAFVNLMEPLISYAPDRVNEDGVQLLDYSRFTGRLAESWDFDPETLTWTFRLRRGVMSCAGNELTADDVVYTFARAKSVSGAAPIGWFLSSVGSIDNFTVDVLTDPGKRALGDEVRKIDRYTVAIRQSAPNKLFLPALATFGILIFDSQAVQEQATEDDPWAHDYVNNVNVPAFGAYCLERWRKDDEMVWRANPGHWAGKPAIDRIILKRIPQSSNRFILLRSGQAHLTERLTPREATVLQQEPDVQVVGVWGNENLFVLMNEDVAPFDNPLIRRAIAAALPREWIIENSYFGTARPWFGVVPSGYPDFRDGAQIHFAGVERARALLAEAGYPNGEGLDAYRDAFKLIYIAEKETVLGPSATAIRTALRAVGFPVELEPIPSTQFGDRKLVKRDLGFAITDQEKPVVPDAGYAVQLFFVSPEEGGVNNMSNYRNPVVDALWAEARDEPDAARRSALISRIQDILIEDIAWLPVVEYRTQWVADPRLRGFVYYPDNAIRFAALRFDR